MATRRVQDDGTIVVDGQIVPAGGSVPTTADVVSYSGNTGLQSTNVEAALDELDDEKASITHLHDDRYFTEAEVTSLLGGKSNTGHTHDDRYFTEVEVTDLLAGKADAGHLHDDRYYTEAEVDTKISDALSSTNLHLNANLDSVALSTVGPSSTTVTERPLATDWGIFWTGGGAPYADVRADDTAENTRLGVGWSTKVTFDAASKSQELDSSVFSVVPGSIIQAEVWVKGNGPRGFITIMTAENANPDWFVTGKLHTDSSLVTATSTWQTIVATHVVPTGHNRCRIKLRSTTNSPGAPGSIWFDDSTTRMTVLPPSGVVTGEIKSWPTATPPAGYLLCNGGTFSSVDYPALASVLGDTFGTHSGTTYFLPYIKPVLPDTDWQNPSYVNGWVDYDGRTVQYRRKNGRVEFRGLMKNGTMGVNAFTLPAGYRPEFRGGVTGGMQHFPVAANAAFGLVTVQNDGQIVFSNGSNGWVDLSSVTYEVGDTTGTVNKIIKT